MEAVPDVRLRKEERLKSRKLLAALFTEGNSVTAFPLRFVWMTLHSNEPWPVQIAFSVSRRKWKRAVDRNLYKRRMREAYRHQKQVLYDAPLPEGFQLLLACIYTADADCTFEQIQRAMHKGLKKLSPLICQ